MAGECEAEDDLRPIYGDCECTPCRLRRIEWNLKQIAAHLGIRS